MTQGHPVQGHRWLRLRLVVGVCLAATSLTWAADAEYKVVDSDSIYYGKGTPKSPAVITADDVWAEIPEYKKIVEEELTDEDPAYHLLMKKATDRFEKALAKVAKRDGYDMIGEVGAIEATDKKKKVVDATKDLIDVVSRG